MMISPLLLTIFRAILVSPCHIQLGRKASQFVGNYVPEATTC
jgi:hypothetical protein